MTKGSDRELLEAAKRGDGASLDALLARHEKQVYRFGLRMCGSEEEAKDVLQDTLLSAFRGIHAFRGDAELSTWLYQIARASCLRARRRRAGVPQAFESLDSSAAQAIASPQETPDEASYARQMGEVLQAAILALPETSREVLILRDVEGLSADQASEVVGIEVRALKSRLHRARMQLREHLATLLGEGASRDGAGCPQLADELVAFSTEALDQATCVRIEDHLASCLQCNQACESLKKTVSLCRKIPGDAVPEPVRRAVRQALSGAVSD